MIKKRVFVLDASVTVAWAFEDETNRYTDAVLDAFTSWGALVPVIWPLEVANALLMAERRKRLSRDIIGQFLTYLQMFPIEVEYVPSENYFGRILTLAREMKLTVYDASYLDLALCHDLPLATQDMALQEAALRCGVKIFRGEENSNS